MIEWTVFPEPVRLCDFLDGAGAEYEQVGLLLRLSDGSEQLIGHINNLGGFCDDCTNNHDLSVVAHRRVWAAGSPG